MQSKRISPVIPGLVREGMKRWARDPNTGEQMYVDANMTYKQWIETVKPSKASKLRQIQDANQITPATGRL